MNETKRGHFISIEGTEGAGKSTAIEFIQKFLAEQDINFLVTREPGGTEVGEKIRSVLLDRENTEMLPDTELLLMFASRAQLVQQVIYPALAKGQWVIADRFTDASYAYQGGGRGIAKERIEKLEAWVLQGLKPDATIYLDIPTSIGLARMKDCKVPDRIEREQQAFFEKVREIYLQRMAAEPERFYMIDATQDIKSVENVLAQFFLTHFLDK